MNFKSKFGEGNTFKDMLNEVKFSTNEVKANIVNINTLIKQVNANWKNLNAQADGIVGKIVGEIDDGMYDVQVRHTSDLKVDLDIFEKTLD